MFTSEQTPIWHMSRRRKSPLCAVLLMHILVNEKKGNSLLGLTGQLTTCSIVSALWLQMTKLWPHSCCPDLSHSSTTVIQWPHNGQTTSYVFSWRWFTVFTRQRKTVHKLNQCLTWKIKPLFLYCSDWHIFWKRVLHKKKEATSSFSKRFPT